jgi:hypothetical protein
MRIKIDTPTIARMVPMKIDPEMTSRLRTKSKLASIKLNRQTIMRASTVHANLNYMINLMRYCLFLILGSLLLVGCQRKSSGLSYDIIRPSDFVSPGSPRSDEVRVASVIGSAGSQNSFVEWYVSTNILSAQPRWDGLSSEVPLSIGKACGLALPYVQKQVPEVQKWSIETVFAENLYRGGETGHMYSYPDIWYYEITFMPTDPLEKTKIENQSFGYALTQIVLLDGTVVKPTIVRQN